MEIRWLSRSSRFAEELHLRPAPARNQTAQSPLSQTIRKLEKDLGAGRRDGVRSVADQVQPAVPHRLADAAAQQQGVPL